MVSIAACLLTIPYRAFLQAVKHQQQNAGQKTNGTEKKEKNQLLLYPRQQTSKMMDRIKPPKRLPSIPQDGQLFLSKTATWEPLIQEVCISRSTYQRKASMNEGNRLLFHAIGGW